MNLGQPSVLLFVPRPDLDCCYVARVLGASVGVDVQAFRATPGDEGVQVNLDAQDLDPAARELLKALVGPVQPFLVRGRQDVPINAQLKETPVVLAADPEDANGLDGLHGGKAST